MMPSIDKWWIHPLVLLILGGPLIDILSLLTQDSIVSASAIIRIVLLIAMFVIFLRSPPSKEKGRSACILVVCSIFFILQMVFVNYENIAELVYQIARMWYFPLFLTMLVGTKMMGYESIPKVLLTATSLYAFVVVLAATLGTSLHTYSNEYQSSGAVGWFQSGNEIGAILAIGAALSLVFISNTKLRNKKLYYLPIFIFIAAPIIGTKVALLGCVLAIVAVLIHYYRKGQKTVLSLRRVIICIAIFLVSLATAPLLQDIAVRNAQVELPQTTNTATSSVDTTNTVTGRIDESTDIVTLIRSKVFSGRIWFLEQRAAEYSEGDTARILLGRGDYSNELKVRTTEMDPFDILFANGVIGLLIYLLAVALPINAALKRSEHKLKDFDSSETFALRIGLVVALILSLLSGHIIVAPAVCVILIGVIYYLIQANPQGKKREAAR